MCTRVDTLAQYLGAPYLDDVMSHNELTTLISYQEITKEESQTMGNYLSK